MLARIAAGLVDINYPRETGLYRNIWSGSYVRNSRKYNYVVVDNYSSGAIYAKLLCLRSGAVDSREIFKAAVDNVAPIKMCNVTSRLTTRPSYLWGRWARLTKRIRMAVLYHSALNGIMCILLVCLPTRFVPCCTTQNAYLTFVGSLCLNVVMHKGSVPLL